MVLVGGNNSLEVGSSWRLDGGRGGAASSGSPMMGGASSWSHLVSKEGDLCDIGVEHYLDLQWGLVVFSPFSHN